MYISIYLFIWNRNILMNRMFTRNIKYFIPCQRDKTYKNMVLSFQKAYFTESNNPNPNDKDKDKFKYDKNKEIDKSLFLSIEQFESNFNKYLEESKKSHSNNTNTKPRKPIRIIEIDMNKDKLRPKKKEYTINLDEQNEENDDFKVPLYADSDVVFGEKDKYPITNYSDFSTTQFNKKINIHTYKYPAYYNLEIKGIVEKPNKKGVVYLCHGLYEYSDMTAFLAKTLSNNGYDVLAMDLRGHGRSEGIRGMLENREAIIGDYIKFIDSTIQEYSNQDKFMMGYSLGGLISHMIANKDKKNTFNGTIQLASPLDNSSIPKKYEWLLKIILSLFTRFPKLSIPIPTSKYILN